MFKGITAFSQYTIKLVKISNFVTEWLIEKKESTDFENLPDIHLEPMLRRFFGSVVKKDGMTYSKSVMIHLLSGLNRYLQLPPHNRMVNLMRNETFIKQTRCSMELSERTNLKVLMSVTPSNLYSRKMSKNCMMII